MPQSEVKQATCSSNASRHWLRDLHIFTLSAFAVAQPFLAALGQRTVYMHDLQIGWLEIGLLLISLMLALPMAFVVIDRIIGQLAIGPIFWIRDAMIFVLFSIVMLTLFRPYGPLINQYAVGLVAYLFLSASILSGLLLTWLYNRSVGFRWWLTIAASGLIAFPGMFSLHFHRFHSREVESRIVKPPKHAVPVVMIVFDEFSGTTLCDDSMELDGKRFPQFARLAERATWYRNATTVSPRTDIAVPAILSGRYPINPLGPIEKNYPGNLLQVIESTNTYHMTVFEPVSRLCPESVKIFEEAPRTAFANFENLFRSFISVYPRLVLTPDTPVYFPTVQREWLGLPSTQHQGWTDFEKFDEGRFNYPGSEYRSNQLQHFVRCLRPTENPSFYFLHTVFPHYPWSFLPSGEQYQWETADPGFPSAGRGELGEDWDRDPATVMRNEYRYRLQVGYADRFVGLLLDRLEQAGLMDQCLLIITADHGVSFRPGHSRRLPDAENYPDILNIPLFIKLPGQRLGAKDDRNVESVDLFPTIAEVLGIDLPYPVDGTPVSQMERQPRKMFYYERQSTIFEPDLPKRQLAAKRQFDLYGKLPLDEFPAAGSSHSDWHGRSIEEFEIGTETIPVEILNNLEGYREYSSEFQTKFVVQCFQRGTLQSSNLPEVPLEILLVADGIIRDSSKTYLIYGSSHGFHFLVPEWANVDPLPKIELMAVDPKSPKRRLIRLRGQPKERQ